MQRSSDDFLVFWWPRGGRERWHISAEQVGDVVLLFDGVLADLATENYQPLTMTPQPYSDFATLGKHAQETGRTLAPAGEVGMESVAIYASFNSTIQREARAFVVKWGPILPRPLPGGIIHTRQSQPRPTFADLEDSTGRLRIVLWRLLVQAVEFYDAVRLLKEVQDAEETWRDQNSEDDPDLVQLRQSELEAPQARLRWLFWERLEGVRLGMGQSTCSDLETAMWLQLSEDLAAGRRWHICKGCGRLFGAAHGSKEYHDEKCRKRAFARRSRAKKGSQS